MPELDPFAKVIETIEVGTHLHLHVRVEIVYDDGIFISFRKITDYGNPTEELDGLVTHTKEEFDKIYKVIAS